MNFFHQYRSLPLLLFTLGLIFVSPFFSHELHRALPLGLFFGLAIGLSINWITGSRKFLLFLLILGVIGVVFFGLQIRFPDSPIIILGENLVVASIHVSALTIALRFSLSRRKPHPLDRVMAGICGYFLIALFFSDIYRIFLAFDGGSFVDHTRNTPLDVAETVYFSLITLTTQGYGDIVPVSDYARVTAAFEGACGTVYLAVLIASVVSELRRH